MQKPESMELIPPDNDGKYVYLMIFPDGNRIDLCITAGTYEESGEPVLLLLDKDGTFPAPRPDEYFRYTHIPSQKQFSDCCNEFHWCLNNAAKGIARDEAPYAMEMMNCYIKDMLILMLGWYVCAEQGKSVYTGKNGKYLKNWLPRDIYIRFLATYSTADRDAMWEAAFRMLSLFGDTARYTAGKLGLAYDEEEEKGIERYMEMVREGEIGGQ